MSAITISARAPVSADWSGKPLALSLSELSLVSAGDNDPEALPGPGLSHPIGLTTITHGVPVAIGSSNRHGAEHVMRGARNFQIIPDLQAGVVEPPARLAWLDPNRAPNPCRPLSTGLVGRFVNVATATQERLRVLDESQNGR